VPVEKSTEWLQYAFSNETDSSATVNLVWEKLSIPFRVEVDLVNTQLQSFRNELRNSKGFVWQTWDEAAQWCLQHNTNLQEAMKWSDTATSPIFGGNNHFQPFATKAQLLQKAGRAAEADALMKKAMPMANMQELHAFGRQLLAQRKNKEALEVFKLNAGKNPNQFTTLIGLVRGHSANGDYKSALKVAKQALPLAPDGLNKINVETMIGKLEQGKDVN
jgi:tetratricopeptide (TPR) repeat protein